MNTKKRNNTSVECWRTTIAGFDIVLLQHPNRTNGPSYFDVQYGQSQQGPFLYAQAASCLGECIMHALACDGKVTDTTD